MQMTDRAPTCFISGETIDLHAITEESLPEWASWFNNPDITRYLPQGLLPNTTEDQRRFLANALEIGRFLAHVRTKKGRLLGVVSLSEIDHFKRSCQMAAVMPIKDEDAPLATQEAICLITEHAFLALDLDRVWAGQIFPGNVRWSQALELIGYATEGIHRTVGRANRASFDTITLAITDAEFQRLTVRRGGRLWPGEQSMQQMYEETRDREPFAMSVNELLLNARRKQDDWLASVDARCLTDRSAEGEARGDALPD